MRCRSGICAPGLRPDGGGGGAAASRRCLRPALLAAELRPRPQNGDGEKGDVHGTADEAAGHAGVSAAACNGSLPRDPLQPQPPGDGGARPSDGQAEANALDVMPLAFAAPQDVPLLLLTVPSKMEVIWPIH
ncbi:hypothetical protein ZWY2020_039284 [Hordeum vulgare]|nr:hypothetical protein ZWY2020_039284 [Hordeum vulgare]